MDVSGSQPTGASTGAAMVFPQPVALGACNVAVNALAVARAECDDAQCVARHAKRGLTHGAFLYELEWGIVEYRGILLTGLALKTYCPQCGKFHERFEVPHVPLTAPCILPT